MINSKSFAKLIKTDKLTEKIFFQNNYIIYNISQICNVSHLENSIKVFYICTHFKRKQLIFMAKNLVIVESPAKAKTIEGFLGKDFLVKSSIGHIRDLPKKGGMAIDIENGFKPTYEVSADKKKVVDELSKLSKKSDIIWLATDEDREGEAIAWHLQESLN